MAKAKKPIFGEVVTAIVTPFTTGNRIDFAAAARLLKHVQRQCDAIVVAGTTGEGPTLSAKEKLALVSCYCEHVITAWTTTRTPGA